MVSSQHWIWVVSHCRNVSAHLILGCMNTRTLYLMVKAGLSKSKTVKKVNSAEIVLVETHLECEKIISGRLRRRGIHIKG